MKFPRSEESRRALLLRLIRPVEEGRSDSLQLTRGRSFEQVELPTEIRRLRGLRSLRCNTLRRIPPWICELENLETLDLSGSRIDRIPPEIGGLVRLRILRLSGAYGPIPSEIRKLAQLRDLSIRMHAWLEPTRETLQRFLYDGGLADLTELESLDLSENSLDACPPGIGALRNLRRLCLRHNLLESLPAEIAGLEHLRLLSLTGNRERYDWATRSRWGHPIAIPDWISSLKSLEVLALGWIGLQEFPRSILELERLRALRMPYNQISTLPAELDRLRELEEFELAGCGLRELPPAFGSLTKLRLLLLDRNELERIPDLSSFSMLEKLRVGGNRLLELPSGIGSLERLRMLNAGGNRITSVPAELASLPNLAILNLAWNPLESVPSELTRSFQSPGLHMFHRPIPKSLPRTRSSRCDP